MSIGQTAPDIALDRLYLDNHSWLSGWMRRRLGCPHHAADLAQELSYVPTDQEALLQVVFEELRRTTPHNQWQAFWRTAMQEQGAAEVAQALGMTQAAVYQASYRMRNQIRERFQALTGAEDAGEGQP